MCLGCYAVLCYQADLWTIDTRHGAEARYGASGVLEHLPDGCAGSRCVPLESSNCWQQSSAKSVQVLMSSIIAWSGRLNMNIQLHPQRKESKVGRTIFRDREATAKPQLPCHCRLAHEITDPIDSTPKGRLDLAALFCAVTASMPFLKPFDDTFPIVPTSRAVTVQCKHMDAWSDPHGISDSQRQSTDHRIKSVVVTRWISSIVF